MNAKKSALGLLSAVICIGTIASAAGNIAATTSNIGTVSAAGGFIYGDVNLDGMVNVLDLSLMKNGVRNGFENNTAKNAADVNKDGKADAKDLQMMQQYLHAKVPAFGTGSSSIIDYGTPMNRDAVMVADFSANKAGDFFASEGWTNGNPFDCGWYADNAVVENNMLTLSIDKDKEGKYNYSGGEFRTNDFYHYGLYEVSMQPIKNPGVVSSFFTYTGPSDNNPWDEIDIEFLGKDTTKVQFNYYTNGVGNHEFMYDLGFDAAEGYHTYSFDWQPDHITWYVDGASVYTANTDIPSTPGKIMMNTWPGTGVDDWLDHYDGKTPLEAHYQWATYNKSNNSTITPPSDPSAIKDYGTPMNKNATMVSDFSANKAGDFFASDGWTNGTMFNCGWVKENAYVKDNMLTLTIDKDNTGKYNYTGGEFRTNEFYGYGYYETSMQPIKNTGVVSSFFTYTGPSDDNPWDEIDIEFLGKDTTKVQFNYFTNGQGNHEKLYDLGFDASEGYHTYGFDWQPDHITWYVDGNPVYTAKDNIPSTPGKIMMNTWPGTGVDNWLGHYDGKTPISAHYQWATFNKSQTGAPSEPTPVVPSSGMNANATMVSNFSAGQAGDFFASDGWTNGNPFDCGWYKSNAVIRNNLLNLTIDKDSTGKYNYSGGEFRTNDFYHYGYYETSMKAIKNNGVVSSFFTYTGPSDDNPWDEIDVEVLGKDTTKVQFNYYTNGTGNHEYMYDLGFDASEGFHRYGFDWQPDHITWYVDGKPVYTANSNIPSTPGKIMMNVWPGTGVDEWLAHFDGKTPLTAQYEWVTYNKQ